MLLPSKPVLQLAIETLDHGSFDLARDHGPNGTLVIFYRGLHCPICIRQMAELDSALPKFAEIGVEVIMISGDDKDRARQTQEKSGMTGPRIGYGLAMSQARDGWKLPLSSARDGSAEPPIFFEPGHFYVAANGTLYFGWAQTTPFARPQLSDIHGGIKYALENGYPPRGMYFGPVYGD